MLWLDTCFITEEICSNRHNQRVERLWRDSHRCVTGTFYRLFYYLEVNNLLDPIDDIHLSSNTVSKKSKEGVAVPQIHTRLSEEQKAMLQEAIDPLEYSNDYGIDLYYYL